LKLPHDELLSKFAFNCNLRPSIVALVVVPGQLAKLATVGWWNVDPGLTAVDPTLAFNA